MRLLSVDGNGKLGLTEFIGDRIPSYAILSHTWGADREEVSFRDVVEGTGAHKLGYKKIEFCQKHASLNGFQYFWIDTCCIDQSSSTELFEAINSMFRWYRNAAQCYVYLTDVKLDGSSSHEKSPEAWITAFRQSRWFTRGWTLQELIAPASVEFFSSDGTELGTKDSLLQELHEITGIPNEVLQGHTLLSKYSIEQRMSWAANRQTKREEDAAYSLLGIFDIYMPLLYGEGRRKALIRLQKEIKESLSTELSAEQYHVPFNLDGAPEGEPVDRASAMDALEDCLLPSLQQPQRHVAVLQGPGNIGKTQLAAEFARRHHSRFGAVFWLDGKTEDSLRRSFADAAGRLAPGQVPWTSEIHKVRSQADLEAQVEDVINWLGLPNNILWLLIFDHVEHDHRGVSVSPGWYDITKYIPNVDHGSVLITTRLPVLGSLGTRVRMDRVDKVETRTIVHKSYNPEDQESKEYILVELPERRPLASSQGPMLLHGGGDSIASQSSQPALEILCTVYGGADVTRYSQILYRGEEDIVVQTSNIGFPDPWYLVLKTIIIFHRYKHSSRLFICTESTGVHYIKPGAISDSTLEGPSLAEVSPRARPASATKHSVTILAIVYGLKEIRFQSVYDYCYSCVNSRQKLVFSNDTMRGDTWPNNHKTGTIFYAVSGDPGIRQISARENEQILFVV